MTREEAKKLSPIIQAFADGKVVQFLGSCGKWFDVGIWSDLLVHPIVTA